MQTSEALGDRFARARKRKEPMLIVIDEDGRIVYEAAENPFDRVAEFCPEPGRLSSQLVAAAKALIAAADSPDPAARSAFVAHGHLLRLRRLTGGPERLFALILEPFRSREPVNVAARRYELTRRECEILMLILEGASAAEIGVALFISNHTVQGYFKRLLKKTNSRNRPSMVAKVLEWNKAPQQPQQFWSTPRTGLPGTGDD